MFVLMYIVGVFLFSYNSGEFITQPLSIIQPSKVYAGFPFTILLKVSMRKEEYPYCFYPPRIDNSDDNMKISLKGINTYEFVDRTEVEINIDAVSDVPGVYKVGPFKLPYLMLTPEIEKELVPDNTSIIPTSFIDFPEIPVYVRDWKKTCLVWAGSILLLLAVAIPIVLYFTRRIVIRKREDLSKEPLELYELLHKARGFRLDGNIYDFLKTLFVIVQRLAKEEGSNKVRDLIDRLQSEINEVGYKGKRLSETELDGYWKEVERFVRESRTSKNENKLK